SEGLKPGLATKWEFPDDKTIVLTLRENVKFQDGTQFNAQAVKFSWDRLMAATTGVRLAAVKAMQSVDITGPNQVTVRLNQPFAADWRDRLLFQSGDGLAIVSPTAVQKLG